MSGLLIAHTNYTFALGTSNQAIFFAQWNPFTAASAGGVLLVCGATMANMDAADTCFSQITVVGGTKVVDIIGTGSAVTYFAGNLIC